MQRTDHKFTLWKKRLVNYHPNERINEAPRKMEVLKESPMGEVCSHCSELIFDKFLLRIKNAGSFHEECLCCCICQMPFNNNLCYLRDSKFYCKADYDRHFRVKCGKCQLSLYPEDLVMRTSTSIFHYGCFSCSLCGASLRQGDEYMIKGPAQFVCRDHFGKPSQQPSPPQLHQPLQQLQPGALGLTSEMQSPNSQPPSLMGTGGPAQPPPLTEIVADGAQGTSDDFIIDTSRPRDGRRGPKRPRTILTAVQRRQFKASFEVSPKPCRKVREALAKETGLSVRVVQVWFQNQRAKMKKMQRRGKLDPEGKRGGSAGGAGAAGDLDSQGGKAVGEGDELNDSLLTDDGESDDDDSFDINSPDASDTFEMQKTPNVAPPTAGAPPPPVPTGPPAPPPAPPAGPPASFASANPIDKLYLMQDAYFTHI